MPGASHKHLLGNGPPQPIVCEWTGGKGRTRNKHQLARCAHSSGKSVGSPKRWRKYSHSHTWSHVMCIHFWMSIIIVCFPLDPVRRGGLSASLPVLFYRPFPFYSAAPLHSERARCVWLILIAFGYGQGGLLFFCLVSQIDTKGEIWEDLSGRRGEGSKKAVLWWLKQRRELFDDMLCAC